MICPKCGQELSRGQKVCPACGTPVRKRGKRILGGAIFVIFFVLIVSCVLIFFNLKGRGDIPDFSFSSVRSLFVKEKAAEPETPEPVAEPEVTEEPEPEATEEPEPVEEPEPTEEPVPAEEPEPAEEPAPAEASEPAGEPEPAEEADAIEVVVPTEAEPVETAAVLEPLEAWRSLERDRFAALRTGWSACLEAEEDAPDALLRGDTRLLLRLFLNGMLGEELQARLSLLPEGEPESWDLAAAGTEDPWAAFRPLLASENFPSILDEYLELVLSNVEQVSVGEELLEAEGILTRCPGSFQIELGASDVRRIASSLIGALRWDDRIGRILDNAEDYAAFQARLDELDYALDTGAIPDGTLRMTVYVDASGRYCGRSLAYDRSAQTDRFLLALPQEDENFALELSVRDGAGLRTLSGRGVLTEDAFRGSFRILRDGKADASIRAELAE